MNTEKLTLTQLEQRLAQPDGATVQRELQARLADLEQRLARQASSPLPRDEFATVFAALKAARAASAVLADWPTDETFSPGAGGLGCRPQSTAL
jgi:hypothetical protein